MPQSSRRHRPHVSSTSQQSPVVRLPDPPAPRQPGAQRLCRCGNAGSSRGGAVRAVGCRVVVARPGHRRRRWAASRASAPRATRSSSTTAPLEAMAAASAGRPRPRPRPRPLPVAAAGRRRPWWHRRASRGTTQVRAVYARLPPPPPPPPGIVGLVCCCCCWDRNRIRRMRFDARC